MKKKAEIFTIERLTTILKEIGEEFGYKVVSNIEINLENTSTIKYFNEENTLLLSIIILYGRPIIQIDIFDKEKKNIFSEAIKENKYEMKTYRPIMDKVYLELGKNVKFLLNTPEKIYDYGEENNWQGLEQKHYEILSKDTSLSQMAVADMQDKGLEIPETLKKFRRYSMGLKDIISSKIAKEKIATRKVASATNILKKKAAWSEKEKEQVGALDDNAVGKYNIYQDMGGEIFITKHKLNDKYALMDTAEDIDTALEKVERDWTEHASFVGYDKELVNEIWFLQENEDSNELVDLSEDYATEKKAAEEDLDVKLKVQKNKPAGLDTSSPKSLPESIRPLMQDLKGKMATLKETEAELADVKAGLDAKYQEAKNKSQIVEKQAEIENLTQNIGKLLFAAKNETFQFQDNLVALTHQTKVVPAKATDKWKFEKVFAKLQELMGDENAQKFLDATLNGLQSQATEKTITELNIFSPTQKQMKTSDTSDTNKFIDTLKEIYTNLRSYFIDVKKANNILEEQLATGTTASKKQVVSKKAETNLVEGKWYRLKGLPFDIQFTGEITEEGEAVFHDRKYREISFDKDFEFIETNRVPMDEEGFKTLWDWAFTNKAVLRYTLNNMFPEDLTAFSKWMNENKTEEEIKAFNEKMPLDYLMKGSSKKAKKVNKKAKMHKKAADNKVRIFLTNLGKYNEGELVGEWVDLPVQNFKPILDKIGIDGKNYEEVFITDYEAPFEIGEYENINALNEKVKKIEALDEEQKDILYSLADEWDFDELYEKVANGNYTYIPQGSIKNAIGENEASNIDLAYGYIDMLGGIEGMSKETLEQYFDYDSFGETLSYDYTTTDKGYVLID